MRKKAPSIHLSNSFHRLISLFHVKFVTVHISIIVFSIVYRYAYIYMDM